MGGSKWRRARDALGLRLCVQAFAERNEMSSSGETGSARSSASDAVLLGGAGESTQGLSKPAPASPSGLRLSKPGVRSCRSTCAICLEAIKPGHGHALFTAECSHTFHFPCIASNVRYGNLICPVCRAKWNEVPLLGPPAPQALPTRTRRLNSPSWSQESGWSTELPRLQTFHLPRHEYVLHSSAQEPSLFDDDEPLALAQTSPHEIRQTESYGHDKGSLGADKGDGDGVNANQVGKHEGNACMHSSPKGNKSVGRSDDSKGLFVDIFPELAAIPRSEFRDKFTVLVHLKASCSKAIQQQDKQQHESVQSATTCEAELDAQNHPNLSQSIMKCPLQPTHLSQSVMRSPLQTCDSTLGRAPIDLVTVLDVSGSMAGIKLTLLKQAMGFVIQNLSPADRLAVVVFSSTAKRLFPLRRMTEDGRRQALQAVDLLVSTGGTNIAEGLRKGAKVLEDRRERNPVSSIMLLSDGQDTYNIGNQWDVAYTNSRSASDYHCLLPGSIRHASQHGLAQLPVHTFGFGSDHDAAAMHAIAEVSGGTFSFIETESIIQDAFAQCIGGLLSVMIQDVQVAITCANSDVQVIAIQAGSYVSNIIDGGQQGFVKIGDFYAEEERDFLVDVKLPGLLSSVDGSSSNDMKVLNATCTYRNTVPQETIQTMVKELFIERPESISMEQNSVCLEVDRQRNRLSTANSIAEAKACADRGDLSTAQSILASRRLAVQESLAGKAGDQLCRALESELTAIQERMANMQLYENSGRPYILSAHSSHSQQRATTRGTSNDSSSMGYDYKTSKMVDMLMRSQTMCPPPPPNAVSRTLLPSKSFPLPVPRSSH
uniref:TSA: Wollemia nobilis Ref_Wollemi_Transcript_3992_2971 transcribed RNA sequence n=1 Tax=Wollemia nobilis TaxID=56998 RepID=A0A0C9RQ28_9CONI